MTSTVSSEDIPHRQYLHPSTANLKLTTFKPFPTSILRTIANERKQRFAQRYSINQSSFETTDDDIDDNYETTTTSDSSRKHSFHVNSPPKFPSEIQIHICPAVSNEQLQMPLSTYQSERRNSDLTLTRLRNSKQTRAENLRRVFLEHRLGRRIHSSFSSTSTLRSFNNRRRSAQPYRRLICTLPRHSKWHFVRQHLHDIAMMNESYARMKLIERDLRWNYLRDEIRRHVIDMREMSILRQQDDEGKVKSSMKTSFDLKSIPSNEVVHVERDGRVYSIATRDLVLGRLINQEDLQLDTFAHLDARRKVAVKQDLLRQQEGRTRMKKHIAFSFCLCNLSFIALMFATMFVCVMKTIIELRSRENF